MLTNAWHWSLSYATLTVHNRIIYLCEMNFILRLLTYSMVQSPSWEANWFAASQQIPRISRNPKVHYRTHKRPPPVPILGRANPVHIPTSHLLEIHLNIIHPSTPRSPQWPLSLRFPHQDPIPPSPHLYALHAQPSPSYHLYRGFPRGLLFFNLRHKKSVQISSLSHPCYTFR